MNKVYLIGNLTRDPELTTTNNGVSVCRLGIAVSRRFANSEGTRETDFFNITAWRGLADNCAKYLAKGRKIAVSGSIQNHTFEQDGVKRIATDIVADDIEFLTTMNSGNDDRGNEEVSALKPVDDDSLPF